MLIKTIQTELLTTYVYDTRTEMGNAAGKAAADLLTQRGYTVERVIK